MRKQPLILVLGLGLMLSGGPGCGGNETGGTGGVDAGGSPGSGGATVGGAAGNGGGGVSTAGSSSGGGGGAGGCSRVSEDDAHCVSMGYPPYAHFCPVPAPRPDPTCVIYNGIGSGDFYCCP
jgi:hypothetical protein